MTTITNYRNGTNYKCFREISLKLTVGGRIIKIRTNRGQLYVGFGKNAKEAWREVMWEYRNSHREVKIE